jgi:D-3-phosphoglycerate dehydrogenase
LAHLLHISIPDDAPPVLRPSAVWPELAARAEIDYYDTLPGSEAVLIERIGAAEAVLNIRSSCKFTERVFDALPALRLLSVWGTGTDHVDLAAAACRSVTVTNTPGVSAVAIAEHTLALLLAVVRRIPQVDASTRRGEWAKGQSVQLRGKTCGIIGLGAIGREFAGLAAAVGMRTIGWTIHQRAMAGIDMVELGELLRVSDVISLHLRLSAQTEGFLGPAQFTQIKPGAILLNTARGGLVDEASMVEALASGRLGGAGLDVFAREPLPAGHPLAALSNVVLTPHCAGITPETLEAGLRMAVENIWRFAGGRPEHVVGL